MGEFFGARGAPVHGNAVPVLSQQQMGPSQAMYLPQGIGAALGVGNTLMPQGLKAGAQDDGLAELMKIYGGGR